MGNCAKSKVPPAFNKNTPHVIKGDLQPIEMPLANIIPEQDFDDILKGIYNFRKQLKIVLSGSIGVGKTTLFENLKATHPEFIFIEEPHIENPYLQHMYYIQNQVLKNVKTYDLAFHNQLKFVQLFLEHILSQFKVSDTSSDVCVFDRFLYDSIIFTETLDMSKVEQECIKKIVEDIMTFLGDDNFLIIHLKCNIGINMQRINERGREMEQKIPEIYIQKLSDMYSEYLYDKNVIDIDCTNLSKDEVASVVNKHIMTRVNNHLSIPKQIEIEKAPTQVYLVGLPKSGKSHFMELLTTRYGQQAHCVFKKEDTEMLKMLNMQLQMDIKSYSTCFHNQTKKIAKVFEDYISFTSKKFCRRPIYIRVGSIDEILIMSEIFRKRELLTQQETEDLNYFGRGLQQMMGRALYIFLDRNIDAISTKLEGSLEKHKINKFIVQDLSGIKDRYTETFTEENMGQRVLVVKFQQIHNLNIQVEQIYNFISNLK